MNVNKNRTFLIEKFLDSVRVNLFEWLERKPTGSFSVTVLANQGGLRGDPDVEIKEKLK